jgi:hypothetical protein
MNPIDRMLLKSVNKIEIWLFPNPDLFKVIFSAFPSEKALLPITKLVETERFGWSTLTWLDLNKKPPKDLLTFAIEKKNVISVTEAVYALKEMWEKDGYEVTVNRQVGEIKERLLGK